MDKREELNSRIEDMKEYISLGNKLDEIIDEPKINNRIKSTLNSLDNYVNIYNREIRSLDEKERILSRYDEQCEDYVKEFANLFESEKEAREHFYKPTENPLKQAYTSLIWAGVSGFLGAVIAPFSLKKSKNCFNAFIGYLKNSKSSLRLAKANSAHRKATTNLFRVLRDREIMEAQTADILTEYGISEDRISQVLKRPEILDHNILENIKEKYVPWL